jgi:hypothetical protein
MGTVSQQIESQKAITNNKGDPTNTWRPTEDDLNAINGYNQKMIYIRHPSLSLSLSYYNTTKWQAA